MDSTRQQLCDTLLLAVKLLQQESEQPKPIPIPKMEQREKRWVRVRDIPAEYNVSRAYAQKLVSDMRKDDQVTANDFIIDGNIRLVRIEALEDFWRRRGMKEEVTA